MKKSDLRLIESRVTASLIRLGYDELAVSCHGEGTVEISGHVASSNDQAVLLAAIKTVTGVRIVTSSLSFKKRR